MDLFVFDLDIVKVNKKEEYYKQYAFNRSRNFGHLYNTLGKTDSIKSIYDHPKSLISKTIRRNKRNV